MGSSSIDIRAVAGAALILAVFISSSCTARDHYVGGDGRWVENPAFNYSIWAGKDRFQVYDRLIFKYEPGNDSVLVVTKPAYESCNTSDPIRRYDDGNTTYSFNISGHFYFVSGAGSHCDRGQRVEIVVMGIRSPPEGPSSNPPSSPGGPPPPSSSSPPGSLAAASAGLHLGVLMVAIPLLFERRPFLPA